MGNLLKAVYFLIYVLVNEGKFNELPTISPEPPEQYRSKHMMSPRIKKLELENC